MIIINSLHHLGSSDLSFYHYHHQWMYRIPHSLTWYPHTHCKIYFTAKEVKEFCPVHSLILPCFTTHTNKLNCEEPTEGSVWCPWMTTHCELGICTYRLSMCSEPVTSIGCQLFHSQNSQGDVPRGRNGSALSHYYQ